LRHTATKKGGFMLGSNLMSSSLSSDDGLETASYDIGLSPRVGYFVNHYLVLGLNFYAGVAGYQKGRLSTVTTGVFARYYFGKTYEKSGEANRLRFFVEGGAFYGFGFGRQVQDDGSVLKQTQRDLGCHIMPGLNYFITKNVALETGLSLSKSRDNGPGQVIYGSIDQLRLNIGLQIFFGKR
jgi:hypothetical protein